MNIFQNRNLLGEIWIRLVEWDLSNYARKVDLKYEIGVNTSNI